MNLPESSDMLCLTSKHNTDRTSRYVSRGVSFVEILVVSAVVLLFFTGLFAGLQTSITIINTSKAEAGALALLNQRLEFIRSLSYDAVGTDGGIPSGTLAQTGTTTLNGVIYTERTLIQYVDAPEDGSGASDSNGITADYKRVKVEYSWTAKGGQVRSRSLISNIVPRGIETVAGGGTLTINVFDASVQPVSGADVRVLNNTTTSTIDVTVSTNADGIASFPGAPAAANYEVSATKAGFSTDQTYSASSSNPNPNPPHIAVVESDVSTLNFAIDATSDLTVRTVGVPTTGTFSDTFSSSVNIENQSSTTVTGGELVLTDNSGVYDAAGSAQSTSTAPGALDSWSVIDFNATTSASTTLIVQVYSVSGGTYTLVPDTALAGNSVGFGSGPVDISSIDAVTYPELALGAVLTTTDSNYTPTLGEWSIEYIINEPTIGSIPFSFESNKSIGTDAGAQPVLKYAATHTTDGAGEVVLSGLEWDIYTLSLNTGAYDIARACNDIPYVLSPGVTETLTLTLEPSVAHSLRVSVVDTSNNPIGGATVRLQNTGVDETEVTSVCGQVFFNAGLSSATDYIVDVSASGYTSENITDVEINGASTLSVTLN